MNYEFNLDTYTAFLIANGNRYSGVEASKALNTTSYGPAHDSISRWLLEQAFEPNDLWDHVQPHVSMNSSLIVDDSTLDKTWSPKNELTSFHWSGNAHKVIRGISLVNLLAAHADACMPVDYRVYENKDDAKNKTNTSSTCSTAQKSEDSRRRT